MNELLLMPFIDQVMFLTMVSGAGLMLLSIILLVTALTAAWLLPAIDLILLRSVQAVTNWLDCQGWLFKHDEVRLPYTTQIAALKGQS